MANTMQKAIYPPNAPSYYQQWKFSPAIDSNGFVFVSGCTGSLDDGTVPEGISAQTKQAFKKIKRCLNSAGVELSDIVEITTYHVGLKRQLEEFIRVKDEFIVEPYPAWTAIGVSELAADGAILEIRVIAMSNCLQQDK